MDWNLQRILFQLTETVIFSVVGLIVCALFFVILVHVSPFSIRKEIEQDQNTSLGIIIGAAIIGISIIIAAAIHG